MALARVTMARRLYVLTGTMVIILMLARRTATTAQIGSSAECSSAPAPGITATTGAVTMGEAGTGAGSAATGIVMAGEDVGSAAIEDFMAVAGSAGTAGFMETADSAVEVASTEVEDSTAEVASMVEAEVTAEAMEDIGKEFGL